MATVHKLFDINDPEAGIIRRLGVESGHLAPSEAESPRVPCGVSAAIRPIGRALLL